MSRDSGVMKGVALQGARRLEVREFPRPPVAPDEVRIKVMAAGICGSDLHFYRSTPEGLGRRFNVIIGHEPGGIVESVGPAVTGFREGDRVVVNHTLGCGRCEHCLRGATVLCDQKQGMAEAGHGADAEYVTMPQRACWYLPKELTYVDGSFIACTGSTAYGVLRKVPAWPDGPLVVFGLGPVGLSVVLLAAAFSKRVIGVDVNRDRLDFARFHGAADVIDASSADPVQEVRSLTAGRGAGAVVETSGTGAARSAAVEAVCRGGTAVLVGLGRDAGNLSAERIIEREIVVQGSKVLPLPKAAELMRLLVERNLHFDALVTKQLPIDDASSAFAEFDRGAVGKFVLRPHQTSGDF